MSTTLLAIMSWAGAANQVRWSMPHYQRSGFDILGTCPDNSRHEWPAAVKYSLPIGRAGYASDDLIRRWVETVAAVLRPEFSEYSDWCVIEYDSMFLRAPPLHPGGLFTHLAGHKLGRGERATHFYHCPWWFDRPAGETIVQHGRSLIGAGQFELGSPDVFLGRIIEETGIRVTETGTFSVNGGSLSFRMPQAIEAARAGVWFAHGLRLESEANQILAAAK